MKKFNVEDRNDMGLIFVKPLKTLGIIMIFVGIISGLYVIASVFQVRPAEAVILGTVTILSGAISTVTLFALAEICNNTIDMRVELRELHMELKEMKERENEAEK